MKGKYWQISQTFFVIFLFSSIIISCLREQEPDEVMESTYQVSDLTTDSVFTSGIEGPAVSPEGILYLVNYDRQGTIGQVTPEGEASLFIELPAGSIGNGIRFDSKGNMYIADYTQHNVLRVDMNTRELSVFAHDSTMNQPNDLAITDDDVLFASDPNWAESTGKLWRVDTQGVVTLLESNMGTTNGIEVSTDGKHLYVNESVQRNVWVYDLDENYNISNKRILIEFDNYGMDGMRCDVEGNLYITRHGKGTVAMVSPAGELIREIPMKGTKPSNIAFGGPEGKTCYVTLQDRGNVETFEAEYPGRAR